MEKKEVWEGQSISSQKKRVGRDDTWFVEVSFGSARQKDEKRKNRKHILIGIGLDTYQKEKIESNQTEKR